jgi:hypothetical protein
MTTTTPSSFAFAALGKPQWTALAAACAAAVLIAPAHAAGEPGSSADNPLPPPTGYDIKPTGKGVEVTLIEDSGTGPNGGGIAAPMLKTTCETKMKMGAGTGVPTIDPGYDEADPFTRVSYVSLQGDRLAQFTRREVYRTEQERGRIGRGDPCQGHYRRIPALVFSLRKIDSRGVQGWEGDLFAGRRTHTIAGPGDHRLLPTSLETPGGGAARLWFGAPAASAAAGAGLSASGTSAVSGWRCNRLRIADGSHRCLLVAQPGLPAPVVNWLAEVTEVPGKPPAAQSTVRLARLVPKVWVDSSVFEPPPGEPYKEVRTGGRAAPPKPEVSR